MPDTFLSNGIAFDCIVDQMSVLAEEAKVLAEDSAALLLRALSRNERTEAIREKYGLYERTR